MRDVEEASEGSLVPTYVAGEREYAYEFSFITLLADGVKYQRLLNSLKQKGFSKENSELIAFDNRGGNLFDGYSFLRRALLEARGKYLVLIHDDVEFHRDNIEDLRRNLSALTDHDPSWAIAGNAGVNAGNVQFRHIEDPHGKNEICGVKAVRSLDENFMILRSDRLVVGSLDLSGFHFYGADLCLQAEFQGSTAYVIPFMLRHHSGGEKSVAFFQGRKEFSEKYSAFFPHHKYATTTGAFIIGGPNFFQRCHRLCTRARLKIKKIYGRFF